MKQYTPPNTSLNVCQHAQITLKLFIQPADNSSILSIRISFPFAFSLLDPTKYQQSTLAIMFFAQECSRFGAKALAVTRLGRGQRWPERNFE